ncbi:MAG TPA: class II glutamine amidotransferase [Fervidobacterium sp.]|nr:class II glutamine amidotransferase [Fervidobacterium sp.]HPT54160.1 class II glutamine amidotransferase [Fervidobacterium sp.]HQE48079.1 class II glutamine amidotransferase [Fervidobacterium sp.]HRD21137.1 class II glutamine amidotransferase [Fervidobacterium sp.]HUM44438.1 class II glutamine amidotransferase [Fervidobacterium sp.]
MCRMAAFSMRQHANVSWIIEYVKHMALCGQKGPHSDGWGYVLIGDDRKIECKSLIPAYDDKDMLLTDDQKFNIGIVHARQASKGLPKTKMQLHPFYKDGKYFAHNGTISTANRKNVFSSDTYDFFEHVLPFNDFEELIRLVREYAKSEEFSGINFLLIDEAEDSLYVGCCYGSKEDEDYFTLYYSCEDDCFSVFSENPLGKALGNYEPMKNGEVFKVLAGKIVERRNLFDECTITQRE